MHLFICYSRQIKKMVKTLEGDFKALGHQVWFDEVLTGGQEWWDQILKKIRECDVFIFALAPETLDSYACKLEYSYASMLNKTILTVLTTDGVSTDLLPPALSKIQYVDYRQQTKQTIFALVNALGNLPPSQSLPDQLPEPPEAPISYLGSLKEQIDTTETLNFDQQTALVLKLKQHLKDSDSPDNALQLLGRLRKRDDLFAKVGDEIDTVLASEKAAPAAAESQFIAPDTATQTVAESGKRKKRGGLVAAIWAGGSIALFLLTANIFGPYVSLRIGTLVVIISGIWLAVKRHQLLTGPEIIIYWLGCSVAFVLVCAVFFENANIRLFGLSDDETGLTIGLMVAIACGIYLIRWWKVKVRKLFDLNSPVHN